MIICSDKVYFPGSYFSDSNIVASAQKLKINYVLDHMPGVHIPIAKQIVSQADINDIVFAKRFQLLFPRNYMMTPEEVTAELTARMRKYDPALELKIQYNHSYI